MRFLSLSILALIVSSGVASADRDRRKDDRRDNRPVVRDNRRNDRPVVRDNRSKVIVRDNRTVVRGGRTVVVRPRYRGAVRANRRAIERRPLYVSGNTFRFHNGRTVVYTRPVFTQRYYDVRFRPQIVVENYPSQYGYVWTSGAWNWDGREWQWASGHYDADPAYSSYYDDGSYDTYDDTGYDEGNDGY